MVGAYALAAGVPVRKYFDRGDLFKLGTLCVICASLVDLMYVGHVDINTNLPLLPLQNFGAAVGNETAGLFFAIAGTCYLVRLTTGPARLLDFLALVPVLVAVVLANERAALANVAVATLVVLLAVVIGHWRHHPRRFNVRSGQVAMVALLAVAIAVMVVVVPAAADRHPAKIPLASTYQNLFHSKGKTESAQDRFNLASEVEQLIPHHLLVGYGLGVEFQYYEAGFQQLQETAYAHDIVLDLWLRLGLIGVLLFTHRVRGVDRRRASGPGADIPTRGSPRSRSAWSPSWRGSSSWLSSSRCSTSTGTPPCSGSASASCVRA